MNRNRQMKGAFKIGDMNIYRNLSVDELESGACVRIKFMLNRKRAK